MPAEAVGASGVMAVVVAGLYTGHAAPTKFTAQSRISDRINWRTIQFLLENGVFLLIGLEIRTLVDHVDPTVLSAGDAILIGLLATAALIVIRFLWIGPLVYALGKREERSEKRTYQGLLALYYYRSNPVSHARQARIRDRLERDYERRRADLEQQRLEHIDWRGGIVLGWSGMRGVVTLAAAQSLPENTPYRPQLILIAFTVAVVSIVVQGGTLPWLIRLLGVQGIDAHEDSKELAALLEDISNVGLQTLDEIETDAATTDPIDPDVIERVRQTSFLSTESAWERARAVRKPGEMPHQRYRELRLSVVDAERERLLELRAQGVYSSRVLAEAQSMLDLEETRLSRRSGEH
jgi:CPA1 family monovalent cation:H+ antiporter